jgi:hypothetical protein
VDWKSPVLWWVCSEIGKVWETICTRVIWMSGEVLNRRLCYRTVQKLLQLEHQRVILKCSCDWKTIIHFQKVIVDEPQRTGVHAQLKLSFEYNTTWFRSRKNYFFFIVLTHTLHYIFKTIKSHTKTLKICPYMFWSPLKSSSGGPWPYFARLLNWNVDLHTDTLYNKCKSTFQFSNIAKYGHWPPDDGFKGDRNM